MNEFVYIKVQHEFAAPAEKVWEIIGDFAGEKGLGEGFATVRWVEGEGVGALRTYDIHPDVGQGTIVERQTARDEEGMYYAYNLVDAPMPWTKYYGSAHVIPMSATTSQVIWTNRYVPTEGDREEHIKRSYLTLEMIEQNMKKLLGIE